MIKIYLTQRYKRKKMNIVTNYTLNIIIRYGQGNQFKEINFDNNV